MTTENTDQVANPEVETPPPQEPPAPTKEELEQARSDALKYEQNWKDAQRVASKKEEELQRLREEAAARGEDREILKAVIAELAARKGITEEEAEADIQRRKPDLSAQFQQIELHGQQRRLAEKVNSYQRAVEQELGLKPEDEEYSIIQAFVLSGKYDKADRRIEALRSKVATKPPETPPKKPELSEEEEEAIARKYIDKKGYTKQEPGSPSAKSSKREDIIKRYAAGDPAVSRKDYEEAMKS